LSLPSRTLGGGGLGNQFGRAARAERALPPDGLKTSHALMGLGSSAERNGKDLRGMKIKQQIMQLRRIVEEWDTLPLAEAEFNLFGRLAEALTAYDHEVRSGHPTSERLCLKCGAPVSQCCC
jgi:hypothetical protein